MKKLLLLGAAILAIQAVPALAADAPAKPADGGPGRHAGKMFEEQDANHDGAISESEYTAFSKKKFTEMDENHDGKVTKEEIKSHREAMRDKWKSEHPGKPGDEKPPVAPPAH